MAETKPQTTTTKSTRQPKTVPMKWLKLGEAKDPAFNEKLFLYDPKQEDHFFAGYLEGKSESSKGVEYKFKFDGYGDAGDEIFTISITHYAICKPPVE